jgi:hypothetical protein
MLRAPGVSVYGLLGSLALGAHTCEGKAGLGCAYMGTQLAGGESSYRSRGPLASLNYASPTDTASYWAIARSLPRPPCSVMRTCT